MTPEECALFVLSDCQDPTLKAKAEGEMDDAFAEAMKDPATKARWDAGIKAFGEDIDKQIAAEVYAEIYGAD